MAADADGRESFIGSSSSGGSHYFEGFSAPPNVQKAVDDMCAGLENKKKKKKRVPLRPFMAGVGRLASIIGPVVIFVVLLSSSFKNDGSRRKANGTSAESNFLRELVNASGHWHLPGCSGMTHSPVIVSSCLVLLISLVLRGIWGKYEELDSWQKSVYWMTDTGGISLFFVGIVDYMLPSLFLNRHTVPGFLIFMTGQSLKEIGWDGEGGTDGDSDQPEAWQRSICWLADFCGGVLVVVGIGEWTSPGLCEDWLFSLGNFALFIAFALRDTAGMNHVGVRAIIRVLQLVGWLSPVLAVADLHLPALASDPLLLVGTALLIVGVAGSVFAAAIETSQLNGSKSWVDTLKRLCANAFAILALGLGQLLLAMVAVDWLITDILDIHVAELALGGFIAVMGSWVALSDTRAASAECEEDDMYSKEAQLRLAKAILSKDKEVLQEDVEHFQGKGGAPESPGGLWPIVFLLTFIVLVWGCQAGI